MQVTEYPSCGWSGCGSSATYTLRDLRSRREVHPQDSVWQVVIGAGFFAYEDGRVVVVRGGRERVVDEGPGVEHFSLATAGRRLYWIRDGTPHVSRAR